jgi:hypothetical protein
MRPAAIPLILAGLAACHPAPRTVGYFKAHPDDSRRVLDQCLSGALDGIECDNARTAQAQIQSEARLNLYKHSF